jgi:tetratricopeptide (TPR) repeat protein
VVLLDPADVTRLRQLAQLRLDERDRPERALAALQSAFRFDPQDLLTLELLAFAFLALGEPAKALSVRREILPFYARGVAADPGPAPTDANAGRLWEVDVFLRYKLARRALAHARAFVRLVPFRADARLKLHEAYLACGSVDGALNELIAAIDLAVLAGNAGDAQRALALAWALAPGHPVAEEKRRELGLPVPSPPVDGGDGA